MVLEGASTSPSGDSSVADGLPSSDLDPYDTRQSSPSRLSSNIALSLDDLPRPAPIIGPLTGYTRGGVAKSIQTGVTQAQRILQRPLVKDEADALAFIIAKSQQTLSWGDGLGLSVGLFRCYQTADSFRFPFYKPDLTNFDPYTLGRWKGPWARMGWHLARALPYGITGLFLGGIFAKSIAATTFALSISRDPRLKDFDNAIRNKAKQKGGDVSGSQRQPASTPTPRENPHPLKDLQEDDMSPQSGSYSESGMLSDNQMRAQESRQRRNEQWSSTEDRGTSFDMDRAASQPRSSSGSYEDASPTAATSGPSNPRESAWDRIRKQSASGQQQSGSTSRGATERSAWDTQGGAYTQGDSFSFSSTEEERQLAKAEAQREFDARVERERQGKDFEDNPRARR